MSAMIMYQPESPMVLHIKKSAPSTIVTCLNLDNTPKKFTKEDCAFLQGVGTMVPEVKDLVDAIMDHGAVTIWAEY